MGMQSGYPHKARKELKSSYYAHLEDGAISPTSLGSALERNPLLPCGRDVVLPAGQRDDGIALAFHHLPTEVIQTILWLVDAESFASLSVLNRQWYRESQKVELYAHHLSRCPSFALSNNLITGPFRKNDLLRLKTKFATEVRRNLFEAYLRPRETLVNLISMSANSSAAFPGGEAFRFSFSPGGQSLLALSSSRIFVIDLTADVPVVRRELKTLRRPLSASVTDDGSVLALLSSRHQANIYALTADGVKHVQVLVLDHPPRTIALAHEGTVLAAAYDGGVEVFSLAANALSTDRRAVRCEGVDSLVFSGDGSMLIGSSYGADDPNTVVISAPFYTENDPDLTDRELHSRMWTTQILFPNNSSTCSHAALLPNHSEGDGTWLFAFDHTLSTYRTVRTDDTRTGVAYFLSPPIYRRFSMPSPSVIPAASECGDLVVAGFSGTGLWIYGVPGKVNQAPDMGSVVERQEARVRGGMRLTSATGHQEPLMAYSPSISNSVDSYGPLEDDSLAGKVDWRQSLFVKCRHLKSIDGTSAAKWVDRKDGKLYGFPGKRLVEVAPGGVSSFAEELGEEPMPIDGGRLMILDFEYAPSTSEKRVITIEVGEKVPELLREQYGDHEVEVALERRRTVRANGNRGGGGRTLGRSITAVSPPASSIDGRLEDSYHPSSVPQPSTPVDEALPSPFVRWRTPSPQNLHRSTTTPALRTARYPPRAPLNLLQGSRQGHIIYPRDARQTPHESDADNWEPPPPPYVHTPSLSQRASYAPQLNGSSAVIPSGQQGIRRVPVASRLDNQQNTQADPVRLRVMQYESAISVRANATPNGVMTHHHALPRNASNQYGPFPRTPQAQGSSDTSADTVREGNKSSQPATVGVVFHPKDKTSSPVSPPNQPTYLNQRGQASCDARLQLLPGQERNVSATITHPVSPPTPEQQPVDPSPTPSPVLPMGASSSGPKTITLSGTNLQNRLNHPVPPLPSGEQQKMDNPYIPPTLKSGQAAPPPALLPRNKDAEPLVSAAPTTDQVANLQRRLSQEGGRSQIPYRKPVRTTASQPANGCRLASGTEDQDSAQTSLFPPSVAQDSAVMPDIPSFNKSQQQTRLANTERYHARGGRLNWGRAASKRGLSYPHGPRRHQHANPSLDTSVSQLSSSVPDLLLRASNGRANTFDSINSRSPASHDSPQPRSPFGRPHTALGHHSNSEPDATNLTITGQQASIAMRMYMDDDHEHRHGVDKGMTRKERNRLKKRDTANGDWNLRSPGKREKRGRRCVVM